MTNIFDFSRGAQLREERLPGARRLVLLTRRLEEEARAAVAAAKAKKEAEERFLKKHEAIPAGIACEVAFEKAAAEIYNKAFSDAYTQEYLLEPSRSAWRDSIASWHKGPPPHEGVWAAEATPVSISLDRPGCLLRYWNGAQWSDCWAPNLTRKQGVSLIQRIEWFGHAPDADGWIKWDGGECPVPKGTVGQVATRWWLSSIAAPLNSLCWKHAGHAGDILAYRIIP